MEELARMISELSNHSGREGYGILYLVVEEAWKHQPTTPRMLELCGSVMQAAGTRDPKTVYRALVRAVDDIWENETARAAAARYFHRQMMEKPSPKDLVAALARHLHSRQSSAGGAAGRKGRTVYRVFQAIRAERYGILACREKPTVRCVATAPIFQERDRAERLVRELSRAGVELERFEELVLGGLLELE